MKLTPLPSIASEASLTLVQVASTPLLGGKVLDKWGAYEHGVAMDLSRPVRLTKVSSSFLETNHEAAGETNLDSLSQRCPETT